MNFQKEKQEFLQKKDKSRKGSIDKKIKKLVDKLNALPEYFTTSSCSGRIILLCPNNRKNEVKWLFNSHEKIKAGKILDGIKLPQEDVWFRMDPAILHVACSSLEAANKLMNKARDIGFRRSGIMSLGKSRCTVELISTEKIETIVAKEKKIVMDGHYFEIIVKEANKKLEKTWRRIGKLCSLIT